MKFQSDSVKVRGPKVDNSWVLTFEVGEYEADKVAELVKVPPGKIIELIVNIK